MSAITHPSLDSGRHPVDKSIIGDIFIDQSSGPDKSIVPDSQTAENGRISADAGALLDERLAEFVLSRPMTSGIDDVRKNHRGAAKDVVLQGHSCVNGNVILDFHIVPNDHPGSDARILSDDAVLSDPALLEDVREMPDLCPGADLARFIDPGRLMDKNFVALVCR